MFSYLPDMKNTQKQAFGGLTSGRLVGKLQNRVFTVSEFCNIIVHVGTNDVNSISTNMYESNMKKIIDDIRIMNPSCTILLSSVLPRLIDFKQSRFKVSNFNETHKTQI